MEAYVNKYGGFANDMERKRLVVLGGGFGGLNLVRALRNDPVDITLVDRSNHHLFQPLLYQVAIGALSPGDIATPLRQTLARQRNVRLVLGEAQRIDRQARQVHLHNGQSLHYDQLVVAVGNQPTYFKHPEWAAHAPGLKELTDALTIRENLYLTFELAAQLEHPSARKPYLTFVVVGGGPTGVEVAGILSQLVDKTIRSDFRNFGRNEISIYLIEGSDRLLAGFDPSLSQAALEDLQHMGIQVVLNTFVESISETEVRAGGITYPTRNVIWAAGNIASPLLATLDTPLDRGGRVLVNPDLSLPGDPEVFVIGDAAHVKGAGDQPLPAVAQPAIQQGKYLSHIIRHDAAPAQRKPFRYNDKGSMATIGRNRAVAEVFGLKLTGFLAWLMWSVIHVVYLISFRNRFRVFLEWVWFYITFRPGARLIYRDRMFRATQQTARPAEAARPTPATATEQDVRRQAAGNPDSTPEAPQKPDGVAAPATA